MIIATAGHIDHGKTTLIKALTGVNADRLAEEQRRGMTIDLGFAYGRRNGLDLAFVDVPGHERFIRNMLAGVSGVDAVLLVVAADDGVMPQTREHLEIVDLLGLDQGVVAITKADMVDADRLAEVELEVSSLLTSTGLRNSPIQPVSGITGLGLDELTDHLRNLAPGTSLQSPNKAFRLAIDRVFTIDGAGLIATGAAHSGQVSVGDSLRVMPSGSLVRVRGLRAHDKPVTTAGRGQRIAVNLTGVSRDEIGRGDWLSAPHLDLPTDRLDIRLRATQPLRHWDAIRFCHGAAVHEGRLALLEAKSITPGETALAQLVLGGPVQAVHGDRFVLRNAGNITTVAGGTVIDPFSPKRGRAKPERLALVRQLADLDLVDGAIAELTATRNGFDLHLYSVGRGISPDAQAELADGLPAVTIGDSLIDQDRWTSLKTEITEFLSRYHQEHPDKAGAGRAELADIGKSAGLSGPAFEAVINRLVSNRHLGRAGSAIALSGHKPRLAPADQKLWKTCEKLFAEAGLRPPRVRELAEELNLEPKVTERFLNRCVGAGLVLKVADNRYFPPLVLNRLGMIAGELDTETQGAFTVRDYKDRSEIGRNLTIELLEFFDRTGLTHRSGETRRLKRSPEELFPTGENPET